MLKETAAPSVTLSERARWLGYGGLVPFVGCLVLMAGSAYRTQAELALVAYGAVILTFIGAIHWGRGLDRQQPILLLVSVIPSLLAWVSLLVSVELAIPMQMSGFALLYAYDRRSYLALHWFRRLRGRLTAGVMTLLALGWLVAVAR